LHQHSRLQRALSCDWTTRQENWWPARVTRPVPRIKSPLHHFNACRPNWCSRLLAHGHYWLRSTSCLFGGCLPRLGLRELPAQRHIMEPPAGDASARFLYKRNPSRCIGTLRQCFDDGWRANASQSPVLPWARLAYDACLNAGSTAIVPKLEPPPELHRADSLTERAHRSKCLRA
jgi:hypothetical protein